jgi:predicted transcriptional regulator
MNFRQLDRNQRKQYARDRLAEFGQGQVQFAKALGVTQSAVSFWVAPHWAVHNTSPRIGVLRKMSKISQESS